MKNLDYNENDFRELKELLKSLPDTKAPPGFESNLMRSLNQIKYKEEQPSIWERILNSVFSIGATASLTTAALVVIMLSIVNNNAETLSDFEKLVPYPVELVSNDVAIEQNNSKQSTDNKNNVGNQSNKKDKTAKDISSLKSENQTGFKSKAVVLSRSATVGLIDHEKITGSPDDSNQPGLNGMTIVYSEKSAFNPVKRQAVSFRAVPASEPEDIMIDSLKSLLKEAQIE
ncbi:MAG: hypothetical protein IAE91_09810 [Ignavibacteriaceae bacterium]|nr:hypothetical protein [Ignavibacteriaceae bacterium]